MSKQRYIQDSFWTDPYIETLDIDEKLLFLYYITNPLCNVAGIYEIRDTRVCYETGLKKERILDIKKKFERDKKILIYENWICLVNFAKNQSPNPNVLIGMQRIIDALPSHLKALKGFERLSHFTLLNLTIYPAKAGSIKSMKTVNYETGEYEEEVASTKRKDVIALAVLFDKMASNHCGKNIVTPKSYFIVLNAINKHKMTPKGITRMFEDWFADSKVSDENKVKLSWCLGKDNINSWKVKN